MQVHILEAGDPWLRSKTCIQPRSDGCEYFVEHHRGELYILTNDAEEEYMIKAAELEGVGERWDIFSAAF